MNQEDKELVLTDLCPRLPYKVKVNIKHKEYGSLIGVLYAVYPDENRIIVDELDKPIAPQNVRCGGFLLDECEIKPYLRKMSSMTEEERKEYHRTFFYHERYDNEHKTGQNCSITFETYDWLNKHHFAYRTIDGKDMFKLGLALEAPDGMYKED